MNEFRILSPLKEQIQIVPALPEELNGHRLAGAEAIMAKGQFGKMIFQHFKGDDFDIWFSNYRLKVPIRFYGGTDEPLLEFHTQYTNSFKAHWKGLLDSNFYNRQYQLTFMREVETLGEFPSMKPCDTFDIHFHKSLLQPYAQYCPRLAKLLENVEARRSSNLLELVCFLSKGMEEAIHAMINYSMFDGLAGQFFTSRVHELLVHMVYHIGQIDKLPEIDPAEIKKAEEAHKLILSNFSVYDTVGELAAKVGTKEHKLQMAFKYRYGITVAKFSREERLKKAHEILSAENDILLSVALAVGYNDTGNFSTAFKNYFKYSPGHINKRLKKQ